MKKEHALYEKRVLRDIFGCNSKEKRWRWRKLHNYSVIAAPIIHHLHHHHYLPPWIRSFDPFRHRRIATVSWGVHDLVFLEVCSWGCVSGFWCCPFFHGGWSSFVYIWVSRLVFQRSLVIFLWLLFLFYFILVLYLKKQDILYQDWCNSIIGRKFSKLHRDFIFLEKMERYTVQELSLAKLFTSEMICVYRNTVMKKGIKKDG